jgi:hypothetical protein
MPITSQELTAQLGRSSARDGYGPAIQEELQFLGFLTSEQRSSLPDWLIIAPPKTGTSWLYANLREHPEAFVPPIKELKYFSQRFDIEDLRSYLDHFRDARGKSKGEASPSYSMLPWSTIRLIRRLMPDLKLIYLMRDPVERAWSHARHSFSQGEANFKGARGTIDEVTDDDWIVNLDDDWNRLSGDYLGQLQRWLSIFPREQVYLGFFEDLVQSPRTLLRAVLKFLQLDPEFADSSAVTVDAVNIGLPKEASPRVSRHLRQTYAGRTAELAEYLDREFQMRVPTAWQRSLGSAIGPGRPIAPVGRERNQPAVGSPAAGSLPWDADDDALARLLARDDLFAMDFLGFNIVRRGAEFLAYPITLGITRPDDFELSWWREQAAQGNCLFADNPYDLKSMILRQTLSRDMPPGSDPARLRQVEVEFDRLFRRQADIETRFADFQQTVGRKMESLECLLVWQSEREAQLAELKQVVGRGFESIELLSRREAEMEVQHSELKRLVARGLEPIDPLRARQARLDREMTRCAEQIHTFQVQLRGARRRLKKLSKNRIIRALRWLDVYFPWRRSRSAYVSQVNRRTDQETKGCIIGRQEARVESEAVDDKHVLPSDGRSAISPASRLNPAARLPAEEGYSCNGKLF